MPHYRRYKVKAAEDFLMTLNKTHSDLTFTMEFAVDDKIFFLGMDIIMNGSKLDTGIY